MTRLWKVLRNWLFKQPEPLNTRALGWLKGELGKKLPDWPDFK